MALSTIFSKDRRTLATLVIAFLLGGMLTLFAFSLTRAQANADIVVEINGEAITQEKFFERLEEQAGPQVLEQLILETLVLQAENTHGITIDQSEIDAEIAMFREAYPSDEAFEEDLARYNLTLGRLQEDIRINLILNKLATMGITISDEEIAEYFEANKEALGEPEQILVRHILVDSEEEAFEIIAELDEGADFAELAQERSLDTGSAIQGGQIGYIQRDSPIVPEFLEAAFNLDVDELSDPVESAFGWHIIRLDERREAKVATLEESRDLIEEILLYEQARPVGQVVGELRDEAAIDVMWERYKSLANEN